MRIGFLGFGEAAYEMSLGLKTEGVECIGAYDVLYGQSEFSDLIVNRAKEAGVKLFSTPKEIFENFDLIIAAVPANKALELSNNIKSYLRKEILYVDVSASTPDVKKQIAEIVQSKGALFVDAAMMGALPIYKHKVPIFVSGLGANKFIDIMTKYGMDIKKISDLPGEASSIKLIRSIFMKGLAALLLEVLQAAQKFGVEEVIISSLAETLNSKPFEYTMNRLITGTAIHSERRFHEMEGVISFLKSINIEPIMTKGTKDKLFWLTQKNLKEKFHGETPESWKEVLKIWDYDDMNKPSSEAIN